MSSFHPLLRPPPLHTRSGETDCFSQLSVRLSVCMSVTNRVRSITLNPLRYFHETWYKFRAPSCDVQRIRTITPPTFVTELSPFEIFNTKIVSAQYL